ncbi:MAG TPA: hypothetical protein VF450_15075 [Noviherbaspirillum sp.]|jgi:hypothetical protein
MGRTLHERVPLKSKHGIAGARSILAWMGLVVAVALFATAIHTFK